MKMDSSSWWWRWSVRRVISQGFLWIRHAHKMLKATGQHYKDTMLLANENFVPEILEACGRSTHHIKSRQWALLQKANAIQAIGLDCMRWEMIQIVFQVWETMVCLNCLYFNYKDVKSLYTIDDRSKILSGMRPNLWLECCFTSWICEHSIRKAIIYR